MNNDGTRWAALPSSIRTEKNRMFVVAVDHHVDIFMSAAKKADVSFVDYDILVRAGGCFLTTSDAHIK